MTPGIRRFVGDVGDLLDRQRVHVGAQADAAVIAAAALQHADDARLADAAMDLDAPAGQEPRDEVGRAHLLHAELGVGMQVAADGDELVGVSGHAVEDRHAGCPAGSGLTTTRGAGGTISAASDARSREPRA